MITSFVKYHGAGNDFLIIDQRNGAFPEGDEALIAAACHRRFGVGADGLILLKDHPSLDFEMIYYNADGKPSSMCGNGGRCIVHFAKSLNIFEKSCKFMAIDGAHEAIIQGDQVELKMNDVYEVKKGEGYYELNTGSPHYVTFVEDIDDIKVVDNGQAIRYSSTYRKEGINVNFVESTSNGLVVFTYERGVEDETLSCGTGVTAAAIAHHVNSKAIETHIQIKTKGGQLEVKFDARDGKYENIWLIGAATPVYRGELDTSKLRLPNTESKYFT